MFLKLLYYIFFLLLAMVVFGIHCNMIKAMEGYGFEPGLLYCLFIIGNGGFQYPLQQDQGCAGLS